MPRFCAQLATILVLALALPACESAAPVKRREIEVIYRFENLRRDAGTSAAGVAPAGTIDEWAAVKPILDHASSRPIQVQQSERRTLGSVELATYEARCSLPSLQTLEQVQADLEALGRREERGERTEAFLAQVTAVYKTNFVAASVNVAVSGASVRGHRIRLYTDARQPPVETTAGSSGIWVARLAVVPEMHWVYGLSEDPTAHIPTRYFRINVTTRKQERVEEPDFLSMFPAAAAPAPALQSSQPARTQAAPAQPASAKSAAQASTARDRTIAEQRKREADEFRKRLAQEDAQYQKRRNPQTAGAGTP